MGKKLLIRVGHPFFSKERFVLCVLFRSFKKNVPFFAFFSVLLKRTERSLRSFGFHKSPKTREKNGKERNILFFEWKRSERSEWKRTRCPTLLLMDTVVQILGGKETVNGYSSSDIRWERNC